MIMRAFVNLEHILIGLEHTLRIEHNERDVAKVVSNAISDLQDQLGITIDRPLLEISETSASGKEVVDQFMKQILEQLKSLSLLICLTLHDRKVEVRLSDRNYLGLSRDRCLGVLKFLQDAKLYNERESFFDTFINSVNKIANCEIKRLVILIAVFEKLGIPEGVSLVAQYLFISAEGLV